MSVDNRGLIAFQNKLAALRDAVPEIMEQLVVGEGVYAVGQAKKICKNDSPDIVNTGHYRNNFHAGNKALGFDGTAEHDGSKPKRSGRYYIIDVYNNLDYAKPLEYGFRSHFVPGKYLSGPIRNDFPDGVYVGPPGGYVRGHFTLLRAIKRTQSTQDARLARKLEKIIRERMQ